MIQKEAVRKTAGFVFEEQKRNKSFLQEEQLEYVEERVEGISAAFVFEEQFVNRG